MVIIVVENVMNNFEEFEKFEETKTFRFDVGDRVRWEETGYELEYRGYFDGFHQAEFVSCSDIGVPRSEIPQKYTGTYWYIHSHEIWTKVDKIDKMAVPLNTADFGWKTDVNVHPWRSDVNLNTFYTPSMQIMVNEENYKNNNKKTIMTKIKEFVKNSLLSPDEKLMRKHGFKDSDGNYTSEAKDFAINKLCSEVEGDFIEIAKGLDEESK